MQSHLHFKAWFHYIPGRCHYGLQRFEEAKKSLVLARDTDQYPNRALSSFNDCVRATARQHHAYLFDAEQLFAAGSEYGLPGNRLFYDAVHPKLAGHRLFAKCLTEMSARILRREE